jgi:sterol desaturase/sphingolipid hydroxylase (fatty acid hydroxylase superfamily)
MTARGRKLVLFFQRETSPSLKNDLGESPNNSLTLMRNIVLIILILLLIGAFPAWPYSSGWGYYPVGGIGLVLLIVLILVLVG